MMGNASIDVICIKNADLGERVSAPPQQHHPRKKGSSAFISHRTKRVFNYLSLQIHCYADIMLNVALECLTLDSLFNNCLCALILISWPY